MNASLSLLEPLDKLQTLSHSFFLSLSSSTPSTTAQGISTSAFTSTAQSLAESIALTHKHQTKQRRITALLDEILSLDQTWRTICLELKSGKDELAEMIEEGEERIKGIKDAKEGGSHLCFIRNKHEPQCILQQRYLIPSYSLTRSLCQHFLLHLQTFHQSLWPRGVSVLIFLCHRSSTPHSRTKRR